MYQTNKPGKTLYISKHEVLSVPSNTNIYILLIMMCVFMGVVMLGTIFLEKFARNFARIFVRRCYHRIYIIY